MARRHWRRGASAAQAHSGAYAPPAPPALHPPTPGITKLSTQYVNLRGERGGAGSDTQRGGIGLAALYLRDMALTRPQAQAACPHRPEKRVSLGEALVDGVLLRLGERSGGNSHIGLLAGLIGQPGRRRTATWVGHGSPEDQGD